MEKAKILVVDNDESLLNLLRLYLEAEGYEPLLAQSPAEALELVVEHPPGVALIDRILDPPLRSDPLLARRPDHVVRSLAPAGRRRAEQGREHVQPHSHTQNLDGLALARRLRHTYPVLPIILMTAHPTLDSAWEAGRLSIYYITKPFATRELVQLIKTALHERRDRKRKSLQTPQPEEGPKTKKSSPRRGSSAKDQ